MYIFVFALFLAGSSIYATADHSSTQSSNVYPHKLAPLKPIPLRASHLGRGDSHGSTPSPTVLGSVQRYGHAGVHMNSNDSYEEVTSMPYSYPISLHDGSRLDALVTSRDPIPIFSRLGNSDNNAQYISTSDLNKSLPASAFPTGHQGDTVTSFDLSTADSDVFAKSDGAIYLSSYG